MSTENDPTNLVDRIRHHPGLTGKSSIGLVAEVFGATDWLTGPGDDAASVAEIDGQTVLAGGEALFPPFVAADPHAAGIAAVLANVNDLAAMGARPNAIIDTIVGPREVARRFLEGLKYAAELYDVRVAGGHLTELDVPPAASACGIGIARTVLSAQAVAPGQELLLACCLDGEMRSDFPFFSSISDRGARLAGDVRLLADAAEAGEIVAAKDVSMAGWIGSLGMLLEYSTTGATIDVAVVPRPADVQLRDWLICFPAFAFLLCAPPERAQECAARFRARGLTCDRIAVINDTGEIRLRLDGEEACVLDLTRESVTGLPDRRDQLIASGGLIPAKRRFIRRRPLDPVAAFRAADELERLRSEER